VPFIRLSDNYIDNPKIVALSEGSFCLWHEGMAYARKHQTDGIVTFNAMRAFRFYTKGREKQLATPYTDGANPLWELIPATGYKIHDYLDWNLSREEEQSERSASAARVRRFREQRRNAVTSTVTEPLRNGHVPDRTGQDRVLPEKGSGEKPRWRSSGGVFAGALPRDHMRHEECGRVCLHSQQFQRFVAKLGGARETAEPTVRGWARAVLKEWEEGPKAAEPIGGNDFQFWDARWAEWQGVSRPAQHSDDAVWAEIARKGPSVRP
jgi:hypothetical protein